MHICHDATDLTYNKPQHIQPQSESARILFLVLTALFSRIILHFGVRNENHIFFSFFPIVSSSKRFAFVFGIILHVHTYYERIWNLLNDGSIGISSSTLTFSFFKCYGIGSCFRNISYLFFSGRESGLQTRNFYNS